MSERQLLTEEWLRETGFKWHQLEREPEKHWLLWLGDIIHDGWTSFEDLGVQVCENRERNGDAETLKDWFCWIRADTSHRYSRFLHVRHIRYVDELIRLIEGLTGNDFISANAMYGSLRAQKQAEHLRKEAERIDHRWLLASEHKWHGIEKDDTRGGALPEHMQDSIDKGTSK